MARTLYKYTKAEFIDSILKDGGRLKLSSPDSFNDPNDCNFGITEENLKRSYRMIKNVAFICEFKNDPHYSKVRSFKKAYELTRKSVYLSHIYDENPAVNILIEHYLKRRKQLADYLAKNKKEFDETYLKIIDNLKNQSLIGSLTTNRTNTLMWAHYADKHEGICAEYEFVDEKGLLDVVYSNNLNCFDLYTVLRYIIPSQYFGVKETKDMDPKCLEACYYPFIRKNKDWKYEKEVRMIFNIIKNSEIINDGGVWFYPNVKVKSIYLGCKMPKSKQKEIEFKCKKLNIPVHHLFSEKGKRDLIILD